MTVDPIYYTRFFDCLNRHGIRYLVVGGLAVAMHGVVRPTMDIDVAVDPNFDQAAQWELVMGELQLRTRVPVSIREVFDPDARRRLKEEMNMIAFTLLPPVNEDGVIDIMFDPPWNFRQAYGMREIVALEGVEVPLVSIQHLIEMKRIAGRDKDLADIANLAALQKA